MWQDAMERVKNGLSWKFGDQKLPGLPGRPGGRLLSADESQYVLYIVGDSVLRNQYVALCDAMGGMITGDPEAKDPRSPSTCSGGLDGRPVLAAFVGALAWDTRSVVEMSRAWPRPSAIYTGAGLWSLWPVPFEQNAAWWNTFPRWEDYELELNQTLTTFASFAPLIVVPTVHSVCDSSYVGDWRTTLKALEANPNMGALPCAQLLLNRNLTSSLPAALDACARGFRRRAAVLELNRRLNATVDAWNSERIAAGGSPARVFDAFALTDGQCGENVEGDSMHFHKLLPAELMGLMDTLGWRGVPSTGDLIYTCRPVRSE